jgi:hypothetical protein
MGSISGCGGIYRSQLSHRTVPHPIRPRIGHLRVKLALHP